MVGAGRFHEFARAPHNCVTGEHRRAERQEPGAVTEKHSEILFVARPVLERGILNTIIGYQLNGAARAPLPRPTVQQVAHTFGSPSLWHLHLRHFNCQSQSCCGS